jgi:glycerophosphoryl diester phosphodiesterase
MRNPSVSDNNGEETGGSANTASLQNHSLRHKLGLSDKMDLLMDNERRRPKQRQRPAVVGHRGALYEHLENTIEGFVQCAEWGCDAVELDVFALIPTTTSSAKTSTTSSSPIIVVFHGNDAHPRGGGGLSGYCLPIDDSGIDEQRSICDLTFDETQQLQFNPDYAEFPCPKERIVSARIPTLQAVLEALRPYDNMHVKIELKGPSPGVVRPVLDLVDRLDMAHRCSYSSFDLMLLAEIRALCPKNQNDDDTDKSRPSTGALFTAPTPEDYLQQAIACGATEVHLRYDECTVTRVQDIHAAGLVSMAWMRGPVGMSHDLQHVYTNVGGAHEKNEHDVTRGEEACYQALIDTGVQQICCNKPNLLLQMLKEKSSSADVTSSNAR